MVRPSLRPLLLGLALATFASCKSNAPGDPGNGGDHGNPTTGDHPTNPTLDSDGDGIPDSQEDRNHSGTVDPGETDPALADSDGDGVPDATEVSTAACAKPNDRPFSVYDVPGADSMVMLDAEVSERSMLRTTDNRAPGAAFVDPRLDVAAILVGKRPAPGVASAGAERDYQQHAILEALGAILGQRTRALTTVQGFAAEQATITLRTNTPETARSLVGKIASGLLNGVRLTGLPSPGGRAGSDVIVQVLTMYRGPDRVVLLVAAAVGAPPSDDQLIRLDELTDGTNVARHESFTRHVCDPFEAKEQSKLDIIWVVDDSRSMEDDQQAVRDAASAMSDVLSAAHVDFRLAVTRTMAADPWNPNRGRLEGPGLTSDLRAFQDTIVVGADGGYEQGLDTGVRAIDLLLPRTPAGAPADPQHLREDASTIVIHLSDERDQDVECAACGACDTYESQQFYCTGPAGQAVIDRFIGEYTDRKATTFAIVGDLPLGCRQSTTRDDFEPGQGYVEVANATGGHFGSLCGDMHQNVEDVARAASGVASEYELSVIPASATIRVAKGLPGAAVQIPRSRTNGFDYDAARNRIIFYGTALPKRGEEIDVGYRRWDWKDNPFRPGDPDPPSPGTPPPPAEGCDLCLANTSCDPTLDTALCEAVCGDVVCMPGYVCLPDIAGCGDPSDLPTNPVDFCGGPCDPGLVCDRGIGQCVVPCEQSGCGAGRICSDVTHLCQVPNL